MTPATDDPSAGLTVLLSGIEGGTYSMTAARQALADAGVPGELRIREWGIAGDIVTNANDIDRNREVAAQIAAELAGFRQSYPNAPITLVGYSGGGGMAVFVAEALDDNVRLEKVVLVQSAVNAEHDLSNVLSKVDGKLIDIHSPGDVIFMGVATQAFGNIDRTFGPAAGKDGFAVEKAIPNATQREKLVEASWTPAMILTGHFGGHLEILGYDWNRAYVAPHLLND